MSNTANQRRRRAERTRAFIDELIKRFPACFTARRDDVRPLAIGIEKDIRKSLDDGDQASDVPTWLIRQALARYTRSPAYLNAIIAGHERINLAGETIEAVTEQAIARAREQRSEQKARAAERRRLRAEEAAEQRRRDRLQQLADRFNQ